MDKVIKPKERLNDIEINVPGDKSISHRAVMFGAISKGETEISGFLTGDDCMSTIGCFKALGIDTYPLSEDKILSIYSANQAFLMIMDFWAKSLKASGEFDKHTRFIVKTTPSSRSWDEWANANGIKVINGKGYKLEADVEQQIEDYIDGIIEEVPYARREDIGKTVDYTEGRKHYAEYLAGLVKCSFAGVKIGLDLANGSATTVAKEVLSPPTEALP